MMSESQTTDQLYFDRTMNKPESLKVAGGIASVFSTPCPGKSTPNEDAAAILPFGERSAVLVIADGLGGGAAGEQASRLAVEVMARAVEENLDEESLLRTAIINGLERANSAVQEMGIGAATTLAVVEIDEGVMRPYHVGDSMILLIGGRGKIKWQTMPHSPVGYGVEAGILDEVEAMNHEDRHIVSNVIGAPDMRIEIGPPSRLAARDTVVLASDGLFDNLHCQEIAETLRGGSLETATQQLVETAQQRMTQAIRSIPSKPDDLTLITYRQAGSKKKQAGN